MITGSRDSHATSLDICGGILDEMEFRNLSGTTGSEKDAKAYVLYRAVRSRVSSRFPIHTPGLLNVVSSAGTRTGFMESHIADVQDDPRVRVTRYSRYAVTPDRFSGVTFDVEIGDETHPSRILPEGEAPRVGARTEQVPIEFKHNYERSVEDALQEISGITTFGSAKLISNRQCLQVCTDLVRPAPTTQDTILLGIHTTPHTIQDFVISEALSEYQFGQTKGMPKINPAVPRKIHCDLSITRDAMGFGMGHLAGYKELSIYDDTRSTHQKVYYPITYIDLVLEIQAPKNDRIDFTKVLGFLHYIQDVLGFTLASFSCDQFQSEYLRQAMIKRGVPSKVVSVDTKVAPYLILRDSLYYGCVNMYPHKPLRDNLIDVELIRNKGKEKVDHTPEGSKDVSDCCAAIASEIVTQHPYDTRIPPDQWMQAARATIQLLHGTAPAATTGPAAVAGAPFSGPKAFATKPARRRPGAFFAP